MENRGPSFDRWALLAIGFGLLLLILAWRVVFPRYEWQPVGDGHALIVHDRWTGRFQRAQWDANGKLLLTDVYTAP